MRCLTPIVWVLSAVGTLGALPPEQIELFEKKIRPILASECVECHGAEKQKGGLRLDYRDGWKKGGDSGETIVPGEPAKSLLVRTIRHEEPDMAMPSKRPKLDDGVIADFEKWIAWGAPDPRDTPPKDGTVAWDTLLEGRKTWWSLQPIRSGGVPAVKDGGWSEHPVDLFLLEKMQAADLSPTSDADPRALVRRFTLLLTGLPPTPEEVDDFVRACEVEQQGGGRPVKSIERLVDRLLASPRFGERWARHWLDLVRYAETHGSEGDPEIPHAWRYRDYVIRAFNDDLPWDQLIREHLAGDLLPNPRWNPTEGWNESILGIAHLRMVEHGYQPVDTRDEQVKVVESQVDVLGKAFQGMTFACARCHDHKFDAVSQRDYFALAGIFESSRPALVTIDTPERLERDRETLRQAKAKLRGAIGAVWAKEADQVAEHLLGEESRARRIAALQNRIGELEARVATLDQAARERVLLRMGAKAAGPLPVARWSFADTRDSLGKLEGRLEGDAKIADGRLQLGGRGHFQTAPLGRDLRERTLEAWVRLASLDQGGGGVMTIENIRGDVFDAIVFAEKDPRLWVAGSDFFRRSHRVSGAQETAGPSEWIHLALTYRGDGETALYRNGTAYGPAWRAAAPGIITYGPDARVLFGLRHTQGKGNGFLRGDVDEARLYDRALAAAEVRASFAAGPELIAIAPDALAGARTPEERKNIDSASAELTATRGELCKLAPAGRDVWAEAIADARKNPHSPLRTWVDKPASTEAPTGVAGPEWKYQHGPGVESVKAGDFSVLPAGERVIAGLYPSGILGGGLTRKHGGSAATQWFRVTHDFISIRAAGQDSQVRLMLDGYPLPNGQIFPRAILAHDAPKWVTMDVKYRKGAWAYLEVVTNDDLTRREKGGPGWFWADRILQHDGAAPPENPLWAPVANGSREEKAIAWESAVKSAVTAWQKEEASPEQVELIDFLVRRGLLASRADHDCWKALVADFRKTDAAIEPARRATGVVEAEPVDAAFLFRGDHHKPEGTVPRGYLSVFGGKPFDPRSSGRLDLAEALVDPRNPLTARVLVNRIWLHVFGRGLVPTPDNFGKMGELPTHPELLDALAARFVAEGWSVKRMLRHLLTTRASQLASTPTALSREKDAENRWLTHFPVRRLEAEGIRDSLLAISGRLEPEMFGMPVGGNAPRRSIYVGVRRTNLNAFLETFDTPKPFTTMGRRDQTNVPAQSLALLNDPFVIECAQSWANRVVKEGQGSVEDRVRAMFTAALARPPTDTEIARAQALLRSVAGDSDLRTHTAAWRDFAQAIFNLKEFIYLR